MSTSNGHHPDVGDKRRAYHERRSYEYPVESHDVTGLHTLSSSEKSNRKQVLFTAFNAADKSSHFKICQLVKTYSKLCNISSFRDEHGQTLLHIACARMSLGTVKILVEDYGFDPIVEDDNGVTPIMIAQRQRKLSVSEYFDDFPKQKHKTWSNGSTSILKTQKPKRTASKLKFSNTESIILTYEESDVPRNIMTPRSNSTYVKERRFDESKSEKERGVSFRVPEDVNSRDRDVEREGFKFPESEAVDSDFEFATYRDMKQRRLSLEKEEERYDAMMSCVDKMTSTLKFFKMVLTVLILIIAVLIALGIFVGLGYLLTTES